MFRSLRIIIVAVSAVVTFGAVRADTPPVQGDAVPMLMRAPAGDRFVELNPQGESILPNGRKITPQGQLFRVQPHPYGLALSPDGRWLVTACSGGPQLSILDLANPKDRYTRP